MAVTKFPCIFSGQNCNVNEIMRQGVHVQCPIKLKRISVLKSDILIEYSFYNLFVLFLLFYQVKILITLVMR